jgi:hypothetical protein
MLKSTASAMEHIKEIKRAKKTYSPKTHKSSIDPCKTLDSDRVSVTDCAITFEVLKKGNKIRVDAIK